MGAPELPLDAENYIQTETIPSQQIISSDDSDDSIAAYDGYQPLGMVDDVSESFVADNDINNVTTTSENNMLSSAGELFSVSERAATEMVHQVWNVGRPIERIQLDTSRTEEIISIMANVSLPSAQIPDWAREIPEDRWKNQLLQQIRQRAEN